MLKIMRFAVALVALAMLAGPLHAASPEVEQAFLDTYKKAFESKDADALRSLLHTDGAEPMALEFYAEMMTAEFGGTITEIRLNELTAEDVKQSEEVMDGPTGGKFILAPKPYKKLFIKIEMKDSNGSSTSTSEAFVAEKDGKVVIATPAPAK